MAVKLMTKVKPVIVSAMHGLGVLDLMRSRQRRDLIILMYHRFSDAPEPFKLCRSEFAKQLAFLSKKYKIISFSDLIDFYQGKSELPDNPLILTIDDGYHDNYSVAYPLLRKFGAPATIFLATDFVSRNAWLWPNKLAYILQQSSRPRFDLSIEGQEFDCRVDSFSGWHHSQLAIFNKLRELGDKKDEILSEIAEFLRVQVPEENTDEFRSLDWRDIQEMQENGINFGSHTCSHPILSSLSSERIDRELRDSKTEIEANLGTSIDVICYPNGQPADISPLTLKLARECGYKAGVTTVPARNGLVTVDRFSLNRCSLTTGENSEIAEVLLRLPKGR